MRGVDLALMRSLCTRVTSYRAIRIHHNHHHHHHGRRHHHHDGSCFIAISASCEEGHTFTGLSSKKKLTGIYVPVQHFRLDISSFKLLRASYRSVHIVSINRVAMSWVKHVAITVVAAAMFVCCAHGLPSGAPTDACEDLTPQHFVAPQDTEPPYILQVAPMDGGFLGETNFFLGCTNITKYLPTQDILT